MERLEPIEDSLDQVGSVDRIIHEPARLLIVAYLCVVESADFLFLLQQTGLTRGNLSSHMSKLESAGYIEVQKEFVRKKPHTMFRITEEGRSAFRSYRKTMKRFLEEVPD